MHLIRSKNSVKFDDKRAQCCTYKYMLDMYTEICTYNNMLDMYAEIYKDPCTAGIACKHEEPLWRNADSEVI